jgi:hypothetical protein
MRITASSWTLPLAFAAASLVTLGMSGTLLFFKSRDGSLTAGLALFMTPFVLAGLGLAYMAARELKRLLRYGTWAIEIADSGGFLGKPLAVRVIPARPVEPTGDLKLSLHCIETVTYRSHGSKGTETKSKTRTIWAGDVAVPAPTAELRAAQPFTTSVDLPSGQPPSGKDGGDSITWQVTIDVPASDGGVSASFTVPVSRA